MPGTTATQGLIYPVSTDRMCDGALAIEVLAKGIQARLTFLDTLVDTGEMPEAVMVEYVPASQSLSQLNGDALTIAGIVWNTVDIDTAQAYDTGISLTSIELPYTAPGQLWELGMSASGAWPGADFVGGDPEQPWSIDLKVVTAQGQPITRFFDVGVPVRSAWGGLGGGSLSMLHKTSAAGERVSASWNGPGSGETLLFSQLWAIRVAEA